MSDPLYVKQHSQQIEGAIGSALSQAIFERAANPVVRVAELMLAAASPSQHAASAIAPANIDQMGPAGWTLAGWLGSTGSVNNAVAHALLSNERTAEQSELDFVRDMGTKYLGDRAGGQAHILRLLQQACVLEAVSAALWDGTMLGASD